MTDDPYLGPERRKKQIHVLWGVTVGQWLLIASTLGGVGTPCVATYIQTTSTAHDVIAIQAQLAGLESKFVRVDDALGRLAAIPPLTERLIHQQDAQDARLNAISDNVRGVETRVTQARGMVDQMLAERRR